MKRSTASRVDLFTESVIREMTRITNLHNGINLAQGFPDFDAPAELIEAAVEALRAGWNQYAITWGSPRLRRAVADKMAWANGVTIDPERHITVTCGATEAMMATLLAVVDPGDEVVIFEPFYENYGPDALLSGARLRYVRLHLDDQAMPFNPGELRAAFGPNTRAIVVNTPHNPTGKVFTEAECATLLDLCRRHDCLLVADEVYEHLTFEGARHVTPAALDRERVLRLGSASKTFSVTGWKIGWACGPAPATEGVRRAHQFLTFCAASPLQEAVAHALREAPARGYYASFQADYALRRAAVLQALTGAGLHPFAPDGTYFVMADYRALGEEEDTAFAARLVRERGVAAIPPRSFYEHPEHGRHLLRFAFCKSVETLEEAGRRLAGGAGRAFSGS